MFFKKTIHLLLCVGLSVLSNETMSCVYVAKIQKIKEIDQIGILRKDKDLAHEWASSDNRQLCAGDEVIVPKNLSQITIHYYSDNDLKKALKSGEKHKIFALEEPCGAWCKFTESLEKLRKKLTMEKVEEEIKIAGDRGTKEGESSEIFMILSAGEGKDSPFYLFSEQGKVPIFWYGGESPYHVVVKDSSDQTVIDEKVEKHETFLNFQDVEPQQTYSLTISSAGYAGYQKTLIFTVPPFPIDSKADKWTLLTTLLQHDKNWRLEIWRQLHELPDSDEKRNFMGHLELDDF